MVVNRICDTIEGGEKRREKVGNNKEERERKRETDRQTGREPYRQTDRQSE